MRWNGGRMEGDVSASLRHCASSSLEWWKNDAAVTARGYSEEYLFAIFEHFWTFLGRFSRFSAIYNHFLAFSGCFEHFSERFAPFAIFVVDFY